MNLRRIRKECSRIGRNISGGVAKLHGNYKYGR